MQVHSGKARGSSRLARTGVELSREARVRLAWMDFYRESHNAARTCRHFGISRQTFYTWRRRFGCFNLASLESGSHRPLGVRQPTWTPAAASKSSLFADVFLRLKILGSFAILPAFFACSATNSSRIEVLRTTGP